MKAASGANSLVDVALALVPRGDADTAIADFLRATQQAFDCDHALLLVHGAIAGGAVPALFSAPELPGPDCSVSALSDHWRTSLSAVEDGELQPLPASCLAGATARHFTLPEFGVLFLAGAADDWDPQTADAFRRILDRTPDAFGNLQKRRQAAQTRRKLSTATRQASVSSNGTA